MKNDLLKIVIGARRTQVIVYTDVPVEEKEEDGFIEKETEPETPLNNVFYNTCVATCDILDKGTSKYRKHNYDRRRRARINSVRELIYNNFNPDYCCMVTLTFDSKMGKDFKELDVCHKEFKKFIQRMHYKYDGFAYVATFSKQKRGNWHYHLICNIHSDTDPLMVKKIWKNGSVYISTIKGGSELREKVNYCIDNMEDVSVKYLQTEKGYLCSKGLQRNIVLCSWKEDDVEECLKYFQEIKTMDSKLIYEKPLQYEESGDVHYVECFRKFPELFKLLPWATLKEGR